MFGVDSGELLIIALIAVVVIGPKDLPRVMRTVGEWIGRARSMANQFRSGVDQMVRESEVAELEQKWREQNEAIMRDHPAPPTVSDWGLPPRPVSLEKAPEPPALAEPDPEAQPPAAPAPPQTIPPLVAPAFPASRTPGPGGDAA